MRILIIDDDPQIPESLSAGFRLHWKDVEVLAAGDGVTGLALFLAQRADVVLLDLSLPQKSGLQVLQEMRKVSDVPIIILTAKGQESDQVSGLDAGADDYVVKPTGYKTIVARIEAMLRRIKARAAYSRLPGFVSGNLAVDFENGAVTLKGQPVRLTPLEYKLLSYLVKNAGQLLTHDALIARLWGEDYGATRDHLKVFVSRLRSKIEMAGGPRMIETERGLGYRFIAEPSSPGRETGTTV